MGQVVGSQRGEAFGWENGEGVEEEAVGVATSNPSHSGLWSQGLSLPTPPGAAEVG